MSLAFAPASVRQGPPPNRATVQKLLDENSQLIQAIVENQNAGRLQDCLQLQEKLHRNLVYLASIADAGQSLLAELQVNPGNSSMSGAGIESQGRRNVGGSSGGNEISQVDHSQPQNQAAPMGQPLQNIQNIPPAPVTSVPQPMPPQYSSHPQHQAPQHQAPQHQAPQHQAPQHQVPQHQTPQHQAPQHQAPQHQVPQHQPPQHQAPQHQQAAYQPQPQQQMNPQATHYTGYYQQQPGPPPPVQQQRYQHPGGYTGYVPPQQAQMQQNPYPYQQGQAVGYANYPHAVNPGQQQHQGMQPGSQMQMQSMGYGGPAPTNNPGPPQH